jgi:hypothetical protein
MSSNPLNSPGAGPSASTQSLDGRDIAQSQQAAGHDIKTGRDNNTGTHISPTEFNFGQGNNFGNVVIYGESPRLVLALTCGEPQANNLPIPAPDEQKYEITSDDLMEKVAAKVAQQIIQYIDGRKNSIPRPSPPVQRAGEYMKIQGRRDLVHQVTDTFEKEFSSKGHQLIRPNSPSTSNSTNVLADGHNPPNNAGDDTLLISISHEPREAESSSAPVTGDIDANLSDSDNEPERPPCAYPRTFNRSPSDSQTTNNNSNSTPALSSGSDNPNDSDGLGPVTPNLEATLAPPLPSSDGNIKTLHYSYEGWLESVKSPLELCPPDLQSEPPAQSRWQTLFSFLLYLQIWPNIAKILKRRRTPSIPQVSPLTQTDFVAWRDPLPEINHSLSDSSRYSDQSSARPSPPESEREFFCETVLCTEPQELLPREMVFAEYVRDEGFRDSIGIKRADCGHPNNTLMTVTLGIREMGEDVDDEECCGSQSSNATCD